MQASVYADTRAFATERLGIQLEGGWRLDAIVAVGGTSWIYEASLPMGARAAAKILHTPLADYPQIVERFVREAFVANKVEHDGVVKAFGQGWIEPTIPYLLMDLLEGETLEARAKRKGGRLPVQEAMWAADQVLDILEAAHKSGIVHRDVRPENIFLTADRKIKLLDFGIARLEEDADEHERGTPIGTPSFMSPEQARGDIDEISVKTDLWALGASVFRLLTGRCVHDEERLVDQLQASMNNPATPLLELAPDVPESIALIIDYALMLDAPARWPNARSMRNALAVATSAAQAPSDETLSTQSSEPSARIFGPPRRPEMSAFERPRVRQPSFHDD